MTPARRRAGVAAVALVLAACVASPRRAAAGVDAWTAGVQPGGEILAAALLGDLCYAASDVLVFRSTDGCRHWSPVPPLANLQVQDVAIDVKQPTTAYAATLAGLWRTLDGGTTWTEITGGGAAGQHFDAVAVDRRTAGDAWFVDDAGGVWHTTASGTGSWSSVTTGLPEPPEGVVVDPTTGWIWSWSFSGSSVSVLTSSGGTWVPAHNGLTVPDTMRRIVPDVGAARLVLGASADAFTLPSTGGPSWVMDDSGLPTTSIFISVAGSATGTTYLVDVLGHVFRLVSGDTFWGEADGGLPSGFAYGVWADAATDGPLLAATGANQLGEGALWRSADRGDNWTRSDDGIAAVFVKAMAADPHQAGRLLITTATDGVQVSDDVGATWRMSVLAGVQRQVAFDPTRPGLVLAETNRGIVRSLDGGVTWSDPDVGNFAFALAFDATGRAIKAANADVQTSIDGGVTWTPLPATGLPAMSFIRVIVPDPVNAGDLWVVTDDDGPFLLPAGAASWSRHASGLPPGGMANLALDAHGAQAMYAATAAGLWRSTDRGTSWTRASGIPSDQIDDVIIDLRLGDVAYAAAGGIVYRTADAGTTWAATATPPNKIDRLAADADGHTLYGGTAGAGVLALSQSAPPVLVSPPTVTGELRPRSVLHGDPGSWDAVPPPTFVFQWLRCTRRGKRCRPIKKKGNQADYRVTAHDLGERLELTVDASNSTGAATATSSLTTPVRHGRSGR
jgi:hypothetical protein